MSNFCFQIFDFVLLILIGQAASQSNSNIYTQWKQDGSTMAGGNGEGSQLNQLFYPYGLCIDNDYQAIYIAECLNHRIVQWKFNAKIGQVIAGGPGPGNQMNKLYRPTSVTIDRKNDSLIICDAGNRRIVEWSRQTYTYKQIIISDIDCYDLTIDKNGNFYVSDRTKNEVRRWKRGETNGTVVAGGNGTGHQLNQLNFPTYIFLDEDDSLYVSDSANHRVMKWIKGAKEGITVAGGYGKGDQLTQLDHPQGVLFDHLGNVYVADSWNNRIMCWSKGATEGHIILGGNGKGQQSNQFYYPEGLSFDRDDNLYVVDCHNARVQKFVRE